MAAPDSPSLSVIDSLPPEILSDIFVVARAANVLDALARAHFEVAPWDLLSITATSSTWRAAALARRDLWTAIFAGYSAAIARWMMENSRGALRELLGDYDGVSRACAVVFEQPEMIREVRLMWDRSTIVETLEELRGVIGAKDRLPHLETLHFSGFLQPPRLPSSQTLTSLVLQHVMAVDVTTLPQAPQLRSFVLRHCMLDSASFRSGMSDFVPLLRERYPRLERLALDNVSLPFFMDEQADVNITQRVLFPALKRLEIQDLLYIVVGTCLRLEVPSDCALRLGIKCDSIILPQEMYWDYLEAFLKPLLAAHASTTALTFSHFAVIPEELALSMSLYPVEPDSPIVVNRSSYNDYLDPLHPAAPVTLEMKGLDVHRFSTTLVRRLNQLVPLESIRSATFSSRLALSPEILRHIQRVLADPQWSYEEKARHTATLPDAVRDVFLEDIPMFSRARHASTIEPYATIAGGVLDVEDNELDLHRNVPHPILLRPWIALLDVLVGATTLGIRTNLPSDLPVLLRALTPTSDETRVPALEHLIVDGVVMPWGALPREIPVLLQTCIKERETRGFPLKKVSMSAGDLATLEAGYIEKLFGELGDVEGTEFCERQSPMFSS